MTLIIGVFISAILLPALALLAGVTIVASLSRAVEIIGGLGPSSSGCEAQPQAEPVGPEGTDK